MLVALTQMALASGPEVTTAGMCCLVVLETLLRGDKCMCTLLQSAVEVNTVSGPYINRHMSSSLNKMYSLLCFTWTLNGNFPPLSLLLTFHVTPPVPSHLTR